MGRAGFWGVVAGFGDAGGRSKDRMIDPATIFTIAFTGVLATGLAALMWLFWLERRE